jgi:hypothetical protein
VGENGCRGLSPLHDKMTIPNFSPYKVIHIPFFDSVRHNVRCGKLYFYPHLLILINMTKWTDLVIPTIDMLEPDRVRIVLEVGGEELGVLYFEKAKKGWTNKPLTNGWTCVDAKVEGLYIYGGDSVTPKELVAWCQQQLTKNIL